MILLPLLLFFAFSNAEAVIDPSGFRLPSPEVETLPNGLRVVWFIDDKLPILDLGVLVQTGTRHDPKGKSGLAEITSRMLERGSNGASAVEFAREVERLGASGFASADEENTTIGMHGLSQDASKLLDLISRVVRSPNLSSEEFEREKIQVSESWRHLGDSADSVSGYLFEKAILNGTVYARGSLDRRESLKNLSLKDVASFYRSNFTPANSILTIVGRVDRSAFKKEILSRFGDWKGSKPKNFSIISEDRKFRVSKDEILIADMPGLPQAQVRFGLRVPGIRSPHRHALAVASSFLGEYFNSRLNLTIRDRLGLAYGIQSSLTYFRDGAFFSIVSATAAPNTGKLVEETIRQLRLMKAADILKEEVETAKDFLIGGFPLRVMTLGAVANRWLSGYSYELGPDFLNEFMPKISEVTREAVLEAVDEAFQLDRLIIVIAGDGKQIEKSLIEKGFKHFRKVPVRSLL